MPFRGVFFDVDGTLIGVCPPPEAFYKEVCQEHGLECAEALAQARAVALGFFHRHGLNYLDDEAGMWREANRQVFLYLGAGEQQAGVCADRFQDLFREGARSHLYPDVLPTLQGLRERGYPLGALTGRLHSSEDMLKGLGIRPYFALYLYAGELGVLKPDPRMYRVALERIGLPAEAVALVGDHPSDVEGARSVGITPVCIVRDHLIPTEDVPRLADLRELLSWLDRQAG